MPPDAPGAVTGEDLEKILAWAKRHKARASAAHDGHGHKH
jgi:hypothetical protein